MKQTSAGNAAKATLRDQVRARRDAMSPEARAAGSAVIAERAIAVIGTTRPSVMAAYRAIYSEVDPQAILDWALRNGIAGALPAVSDATTLLFRRYRPGDPLASGGFGTLAPTREAAEVDPDLVISPMIAFDRSGMRLGHGRGFYDRMIARLRAKGVRPLLIGVAFAAQEVPAIPAEAHDVKMDWIVTENETLDFRR